MASSTSPHTTTLSPRIRYKPCSISELGSGSSGVRIMRSIVLVRTRFVSWSVDRSVPRRVRPSTVRIRTFSIHDVDTLAGSMSTIKARTKGTTHYLHRSEGTWCRSWELSNSEHIMKGSSLCANRLDFWQLRSKCLCERFASCSPQRGADSRRASRRMRSFPLPVSIAVPRRKKESFEFSFPWNWEEILGDLIDGFNCLRMPTLSRVLQTAARVPEWNKNRRGIRFEKQAVTSRRWMDLDRVFVRILF